MKKAIPSGIVAAIAFSVPAWAEVPHVATDIAPVHSLVAQVMGELGEPDLILPPGVSPHGYSLRPSHARALSRAETVFWVGPELTPWLEGTLETLAGEAELVELLEAPETRALPFRETAIFGTELPRDDHAESDDHAGHDEHAEHDDHAENEDHASHSHEGNDPHAWLDPGNAAAWLTTIANVLSEVDPENAATYAANAKAARDELTALEAEISARLEPLHGLRYVVFHDAYQYFETAFDLPAMGAISLGDATDPGAGRLAELRSMVQEAGVTCLAAEPQFDPALVDTLAGGGDMATTVLDPLGTEITPGVGFYAAMLSDLADSLLECR